MAALRLPGRSVAVDGTAALARADVPSRQRRALAATIAAVEGNHGLQGMISRLNLLAPGPVVQRDGPADPAAAPTGITIQLGPVTIATFSALLAANRVMAAQLQSDAQAVAVGQPTRTAADDLIAQEKSLEPFLSGKGDAPLDQTWASQAQLWYDSFVKARDDIDRFQKAQAAADLQRAQAASDEAQKDLEGVSDYVADLQRAAFLAEKPELLEQIQKVIANSLMAAAALGEVSQKASEIRGMLDLPTTHAAESLERFQEAVEKAHKVVAGLELLQGSLTLLHGGKGTTDMDQGMNRLSTMYGMVAPAGSLVGLSAPYLLYVQQLLTVAQAAIAAIQVIAREHHHEFNQFYIETGDLGSVDWSTEPGGRATFDFMTAVMRAEDSTGVPDPIPPEVDRLIVDEKESFEAGTGEDVATTGFWFWKHVDRSKAKYWLIRNRQSVWAMLYGSIKPPA